MIDVAREPYVSWECSSCGNRQLSESVAGVNWVECEKCGKGPDGMVLDTKVPKGALWVHGEEEVT